MLNDKTDKLMRIVVDQGKITETLKQERVTK